MYHNCVEMSVVLFGEGHVLNPFEVCTTRVTGNCMRKLLLQSAEQHSDTEMRQMLRNVDDVL